MITRCSKCQSTNTKITVKLIPTSVHNCPHKYIPQLKLTCENNHYLKFAAQEPEVIAKINEKLRDVKI